MVVITMYSVSWCGHCRTMKPIWDAVKRDMPHIVFEEIDGDKTKDPIVRGYPTIIASVRGVQKKYYGDPNYDSLKNWIAKIW